MYNNSRCGCLYFSQVKEENCFCASRLPLFQQTKYIYLQSTLSLSSNKLFKKGTPYVQTAA